MSFTAQVSASSSSSSNALQVRRPNSNTKFYVDLGREVVAYFTEASGLSVTTEVETYKEGGFNNYVHQLPTRTSYSNLTLKSGFVDGDALFNWYFNNTAQGTPQLKDISIILYSGEETSTRVLTINLYGAYPVKWVGPSLRANETQSMAVAELEITFKRFEIGS